MRREMSHGREPRCPGTVPRLSRAEVRGQPPDNAAGHCELRPPGSGQPQPPDADGRYSHHRDTRKDLP